MSNKQEGAAEGCLAALVILIIGIPLASILYAWAAMLNWNWFATTLGAPRIGFLQAYGLSLVISAFTSSNGVSQTKKEERSLSQIMVKMFLYIMLRYIIFVGLGYAVHIAMAP